MNLEIISFWKEGFIKLNKIDRKKLQIELNIIYYNMWYEHIKSGDLCWKYEDSGKKRTKTSVWNSIFLKMRKTQCAKVSRLTNLPQEYV